MQIIYEYFPSFAQQSAFLRYTAAIKRQEVCTMNLTSALDYFIAVSGILIIAISFGWNIYEVFIRKSTQNPNGNPKQQENSNP